MPFRHAHYWVAALIALTVLGFWPGYFSVLATAPWGFHLHGITAALWLLLLAAQSWTAHSRRLPLHGALGRLSLGLFPIFFAGGGAVILSMAVGTATGDPFYHIYGARLALMDLAAVGLVGWLYHGALANRRTAQLHARYLVATTLPLISPIAGRVVGHLAPGLAIHGPQDFHLFAWSARIGNVIALVLTLWLYRTAPRYGRPFVVVGAVIVAQSILFDTVGVATLWQSTFRALAPLPVAPLLLAAALVGVGIEWIGWQAGLRAGRRSVVAA